MSNHSLRVSMALLVAGVLLQPAGVRADSFEFIKYDPPRGWTVVNADEGKAYERPDKNGVIVLHRSWYASHMTWQEDVYAAFNSTWRELVEVKIPGASQKFTPQILREGDYAIAMGAQPVEIEGKVAVAMLTAIVGRGRKLGIEGLSKLAVLGISGSDEARREIAAFLNTLALKELGPPPDPDPSVLVGRWSKSATNYNNFYYTFTDKGLYFYEAPARGPRSGTYSVQRNRITLTDSTNRATSHTFRFECMDGKVHLELSSEAGDYLSEHQRC